MTICVWFCGWKFSLEDYRHSAFSILLYKHRTLKIYFWYVHNTNTTGCSRFFALNHQNTSIKRNWTPNAVVGPWPQPCQSEMELVSSTSCAAGAPWSWSLPSFVFQVCDIQTHSGLPAPAPRAGPMHYSGDLKATTDPHWSWPGGKVLCHQHLLFSVLHCCLIC